jgi:sugar lactone lactonase YvrE
MRAGHQGSWFDRFLGRGRAAVTVPPLDGALKPNNLLEEAPPGLRLAGADNLVATSAGVFASSLSRLLRFQPGQQLVQTVYDAPGVITAVAAASNGTMALATEEAGLQLMGRGGGVAAVPADSLPWRCITALAFAPDGGLVVAVGSERNRAEDWQRDLLNGERSGSLWRVDPTTGERRRLAAQLAFPSGVHCDAAGRLIVSEAWDKHLIRMGMDGGRTESVLEDLPGYPARLSASSRGGYWLSVFAPRSQLIEFVLREPGYRAAMMAEVPEAYWVAPALASGHSFCEPMQGGALKQMGILKPWAPTWSYGLVVELGPNFVPIRSFHSRAGGHRHGITAAIEVDGQLIAASKGAGEIVTIDLRVQA